MTWWILCGISLESCYDLSNISPWDEIRKTHFPNFHAKRARSTALGSSESCPNKLSPKVLFFFEKIALASEKNRSPAEKYPRKNSGQKPLEKSKTTNRCLVAENPTRNDLRSYMISGPTSSQWMRMETPHLPKHQRYVMAWRPETRCFSRGTGWFQRWFCWIFNREHADLSKFRNFWSPWSFPILLQ